jgi:hypothetical protein
MFIRCLGIVLCLAGRSRRHARRGAGMESFLSLFCRTSESNDLFCVRRHWFIAKALAVAVAPTETNY